MGPRWLFITFAVLIAGCTPASSFRDVPTSTASKPASIEEAFQQAQAIRLGKSTNISVSPGLVPLVSMGDANLLVVPVMIDRSRSHTIKVKSYVVQRNDGSYALFYPVLSLVDQSFHLYQTVKPKFEFNFSLEKNELTNEFEVPAGVERLLVHTDTEYFRGSFVGTAYQGSDPDPVHGFVSFMGGAVGALLVEVMTERRKEKEFRLGEVGVVSIETD